MEYSAVGCDWSVTIDSFPCHATIFNKVLDYESDNCKLNQVRKYNLLKLRISKQAKNINEA